MKTAGCNRSLLIWSIVLWVVSFCAIVPFNLVLWETITLAVLGASAFCGALFYDRKLPRVFTKTLWTVAAVLRWLLLAYVIYAVVFVVNANENVAEEDVLETCAEILFNALVQIVSLCIMTFPSQAMVANCSKRDASRPAWMGVFHLLVSLVLYGFGTLANKFVAVVTDFLFEGAFGIVLELMLVLGLLTVSFAIPAVAIRGVLQQKTVSDETPETVEEASE